MYLLHIHNLHIHWKSFILEQKSLSLNVPADSNFYKNREAL